MQILAPFCNALYQLNPSVNQYTRIYVSLPIYTINKSTKIITISVLHAHVSLERPYHFRSRNRTRAFVGVIVTPGFQRRRISFCSSNDFDLRSSGTRISYRLTRAAKIHTLSVTAKRWPMQLLAPAEKAKTGREKASIYQRTKKHRGKNGRTCVTRPFVRFGIDESLRLEGLGVIAPIHC